MKTLLVNLSVEELQVLEAWMWEHIHGDVSGPVHRMAKEHGLSMLSFFQKSMPLLQVWSIERYPDLLRKECPYPAIPMIWPWVGMSQDEVFQMIQARVDALER